MDEIIRASARLPVALSRGIDAVEARTHAGWGCGGIDTLDASGEPAERAAQVIAVIPAIRSVRSRRGRRDAFVPVDVVAEQPGA